VLVRVEEPQGTSWAPVTLAGPPANVTLQAQVKPVRAVRIVFTGPLGSYEPSVQTLAGTTVVSIPRGRAAAAADGSYHEIANVDANTTPPTHTMFVQLPTDIEDPLGFFLRVVNRSQSSNRTDSAPDIEKDAPLAEASAGARRTPIDVDSGPSSMSSELLQPFAKTMFMLCVVLAVRIAVGVSISISVFVTVGDSVGIDVIVDVGVLER
jgi:hypothetical protein